MKISNFHKWGVGVLGCRGVGGLRPSWLILAIVILLAGFGMGATSEPSVCCERTTTGAWCVNDVEGNCAAGFNSAPTSCETTSYCRLGTCYDSEEGICMGNTPSRVCNDNGGTWDERDVDEVPQCQLGCCVISDQAAFVSLVRCKKLSTFFEVENDYRTDITSEVKCIAEAQSQDEGACVYEKEFERVCGFTTRGDCNAVDEVDVVVGSNESGVSSSGGKTFYKDFLCSAEELNTVCARQTTTGCYQGDVYWFDSCGNRENVYSSNKERSWNNGKVRKAGDVCGANDGSDKDCGNCDYLLGSRCSEFDSFRGGPEYGDYYCQKTECRDRDGNERINGESWCVTGSDASRAGSGELGVGSRYYREICVDGEVKVEPCADFRNEICIEGFTDTSAGEFETAACRVNRWHDCIYQKEKDDCLNIDRRDCQWVDSIKGIFLEGASGGDYETTYSNPGDSSDNAFNNPTATGSVVAPITGNSIFGGGDDGDEVTGVGVVKRICVPNFPPGLEFWKEGSASAICEQASAKCVVSYEKGLLDNSWDCVDNCKCLKDSWGTQANKLCSYIGDCGAAVNYDGEYSDDGYKWTVDDVEKKL